MFYIHGGAFLTGSSTNDELDGRFLSKSTNTIVVSLNYRLGKYNYVCMFTVLS